MNKKGITSQTVLMITSAFPGDVDDGQGIIIARLAESLVELNQRVIILAPHSIGVPFRYNYRNVLVYRFPFFIPLKYEKLAQTPGMLYHLSNTAIGKIQLPLLMCCELIATLLICRKEQVSIIHTHWILPHGIIGVLVGTLLSIPHICSIHGTDVTVTHSYPILSAVIRNIACRCDHITVNSRYTREVLMSCSKDLIPPMIIPMGVDNTMTETLCWDIARQKEEKHLILYVGRLIKWKGVHILIQAMKLVTTHIPDASLVIVGYGGCMGRLQDMVNELHLSSMIIFTGRVSNKELSTWYQKASVFVLPSISVEGQTEGLGVVLLEAMAAGVPVIGSNIGGIPDIIEDGINGLLVPPEDPKALAEAIIRILSNPDLMEEFQKTGLDIVRERFSWDVIAEEFIENYREIIQNS